MQAGSYGTQRRADVEQLIGYKIEKQLGVGQGAVLARGCMQSNTAQAQIEWTWVQGDALSKGKFEDMLPRTPDAGVLRASRQLARHSTG